MESAQNSLWSTIVCPSWVVTLIIAKCSLTFLSRGILAKASGSSHGQLALHQYCSLDRKHLERATASMFAPEAEPHASCRILTDVVMRKYHTVLMAEGQLRRLQSASLPRRARQRLPGARAFKSSPSVGASSPRKPSSPSKHRLGCIRGFAGKLPDPKIRTPRDRQRLHCHIIMAICLQPSYMAWGHF